MAKISDQQIVNFTVGDVNYGVPVDQVKEVRDMQSVTPVPGAPSYIDGVTNLRGRIITVMNLRKRLELPEKEGGDKKIIVVESEDLKLGVIVDSVTEVSTISSEDIEVTTKLADYVIGVGKQGDNLIVILNLAKIAAGAADQLPLQGEDTVEIVASLPDQLSIQEQNTAKKSSVAKRVSRTK